MDCRRTLVYSNGVAYITAGPNVVSFSTSNHQRLKTYSGHEKGLSAIWVGKSELVSASYDQTIRVWNIKGGHTITTIRHPIDFTYPINLRVVTLADSRKVITVSGGVDPDQDPQGMAGRAYAYDYVSGALLHEFKTEFQGTIRGHHTDRGVLFTCSDVVTAFRIRTGARIGIYAPSELDPRETDIEWAQIAHDKLITGGRMTGTIRIWDVESQEHIRALEVGPTCTFILEVPMSAAPSTSSAKVAAPGQATAADNAGPRLLTGDMGGVLHLWDMDSGKELASVKVGESRVNDVLVIGNNAYASSKTNDGVQGYALNEKLAHKVSYPGSKNITIDLAYDPLGNRLYAQDIDGINVFDAKSGDLQSKYVPIEPAMRSAAIIGTKLFTVYEGWTRSSYTGDSFISVLDTSQQDSEHRLLTKLEGHSDQIWALLPSHDNSILYSCGGDGQVFAWDVASFKQLAVCNLNITGAATALALSKSGSKLYVGTSDAQVWICNTADLRSEPEVISVAEVDKVSALLVSGNSLLVAGVTVFVIDLNTRTPVQHFVHLGDQAINGLAIYGNILFTGGASGVVRGWDMKYGDEIIRWEDHSDSIQSLAVNHNLLISAGSDAAVHVRDLRSGLHLRRINNHYKTINCMQVSGNLVYTFSSNMISINTFLLAKQTILQLREPLVETSKLDSLMETYSVLATFWLSVGLLLVEFFQLIGFAFKPPDVWKNSSLQEALARLPEFGFNLPEVNYLTVYGLTVAFVLGFLLLFAVQESLEQNRFLNPHKSRPKYIWATAVFVSRVISRPMFIPVFSVFILAFICTDQGQLEQLPEIICNTPIHGVMIAGVILLFMLYVPLCIRLFLVGGNLNNIEASQNGWLDWSRDAFQKQDDHALAVINPKNAAVLIAFKMLIVLLPYIVTVTTTLYFSLITLSVGIFILDLALPSFMSRTANKSRLALDAGVIWTNIAGLLASTVFAEDADGVRAITLWLLGTFASFVLGFFFSDLGSARASLSRFFYRRKIASLLSAAPGGGSRNFVFRSLFNHFWDVQNGSANSDAQQAFADLCQSWSAKTLPVSQLYVFLRSHEDPKTWKTDSLPTTPPPPVPEPPV